MKSIQLAGFFVMNASLALKTTSLFLANAWRWLVWAVLFGLAWGFLAWLVVDLMIGGLYAGSAFLGILLLIGAWSTYKAVFMSRAPLSRFLWPVVRYMLGMSVAVGLMFVGGLYTVAGALICIYMWFNYVLTIERGYDAGTIFDPTKELGKFNKYLMTDPMFYDNALNDHYVSEDSLYRNQHH